MEGTWVGLKRTVLVVDPDEETVDRLRVILEAEGYRVVGASRGTEGLAEAHARRPDLILLSADLPVLTPADFIRMLRTHPDTASIPVVMLSEYEAKLDARGLYDRDDGTRFYPASSTVSTE